MNQVITDI